VSARDCDIVKENVAVGMAADQHLVGVESNSATPPGALPHNEDAEGTVGDFEDFLTLKFLRGQRARGNSVDHGGFVACDRT